MMRIHGLRCCTCKHPLLEGRECRLDIAGMPDDRLSQFGTLQHRQVRPFAGWRHEVRGIPDQRHAGYPVPAMPEGKRVDHPR